MAIDTSTPRSRRSLLARAMGGAAAALAATVAGPRKVLAAGDDGQVINVGDQLLDVQTATQLVNGTNSSSVLIAINNQAVTGVLGVSFRGRGVEGYTGGGGVAVYGEAGGNNGTGVEGTATDTGGTAVRGRTLGNHSQVAVSADGSSGNGEGIAVLARTKNGIGVYAKRLAATPSRRSAGPSSRAAAR